MKKIQWKCICCAAWLFAASTFAAPVKLGILSDGLCGAAAELLTVELGRTVEFELVERDQIEKVLAEQSAAALSEDPGAAIKVGGLLHADAILFIGGRNVRGAFQRVLRLSAVEPGVVVHVVTEAAPEAAGEPAWAKSLAFRLGPMAEKLKLKKDQLIPFSVLNFRSETGGEENRELERKITAAVEEQLAAQPGVVLLERRKLDALEFERICKWDRETAHFWTCGGLIDGSIAAGTETNLFKLTGIYNPPGGDTPRKVAVSLETDKLDFAAKVCAEGLVQQFAKYRKVDCWSPMAEGERFWKEAKSAYNAKLYPEAAAALEVAGILGFKAKEMSRMRTEVNLKAAFGEAEVDAGAAGEKAARRATVLSRLNPEYARRAAESFEQELEANAGLPDITLLPGLQEFSVAATKFMVLLNDGGVPNEFAEDEKELCEILTRVYTRILARVETATGNLHVIYNNSVAAGSFRDRTRAWCLAVVRFAPAWTVSDDATLVFYRKLCRVFEQPALLPDFSNGRWLPPLEERMGAFYYDKRDTSYHDEQIIYPFILNKKTGLYNEAVERSWAEEFAKYGTDFSRLSIQAFRVGTLNRNRLTFEQSAVGYKAYYSVQRPMVTKAEEFWREFERKTQVQYHRQNRKSPHSLPDCLRYSSIDAELCWEMDVIDLARALMKDVHPKQPGTAENLGGMEIKVVDMKSADSNHWFLVAAYVLEAGRKQGHLFVARRDQGGRETVIQLNEKPMALHMDPAQLWAVEGNQVVAAVDGDLLVHDIDLNRRVVVKTHEMCRWPVIAGSYIYCAFGGEASGLLRVHRDSHVCEVLASTRRKPARTPFDDQAPFWIGPGWSLNDGKVGFFGQWPHPEDKTKSGMRVLSVDKETGRLSFWPNDDKENQLPGHIVPERIRLIKGDGVHTLATTLYSAEFRGEAWRLTTYYNKHRLSLRNNHGAYRLRGSHAASASMRPAYWMNMTAAMPGEAIFNIYDDLWPDGARRFVLYSPGEEPGLHWCHILFPYVEPRWPGSCFENPCGIHSDQDFVYLYPGFLPGPVRNNVVDVRVWRIPRAKLAQNPLTPAEIQKNNRALLAGHPVAGVVGMGFKDGVERLKEAGLIDAANGHRTEQDGSALLHVFETDGIKISEMDGAIGWIERRRGNGEHFAENARDRLPFGLSWQSTPQDVRGRLGFPDGTATSGLSGDKHVTYRLDDHWFVLIYDASSNIAYGKPVRPVAYRVLKMPKEDKDYTAIEQVERYGICQLPGMSASNAFRRLASDGYLTEEEVPGDVLLADDSIREFPASGLRVFVSRGIVKAVEMHFDPVSGITPFAKPLPLGLTPKRTSDQVPKPLIPYKTEEGAFHFAKNKPVQKFEIGQVVLYMVYNGEGDAYARNTKWLSFIRIEHR